MSITRVTSSPVSEERYNIELPGGRYSALVRPPNFDELATAASAGDVPEQMLKLFELCVVEPGPKLTTAAKKSIGVQIHEKLTGEDFTAVEVSEHELNDDAAADALEAKRKGNPSKEFVCLLMDEKLYVLFAPEPSLVDNLTKRKANGGVAAALAFVERHLFHGDLASLKRERPAGVLEICRKMCEIGGVSMQADVKKA